MLSIITRREIENKFGKEIRYPTDCDALSAHISLVTEQSISPSTLKRILGFVHGTKEPRLYTLDVIARYLGATNWDDYLEKFSNVDNSEFTSLELVDISGLKRNTRIEFSYEPDRKVEIVYRGNFCFVVAGSMNSKIVTKDVLKIFHIIKHYPLVISSLKRDGQEMGQFKAGKISGITDIKVFDP